MSIFSNPAADVGKYQKQQKDAVEDFQEEIEDKIDVKNNYNALQAMAAASPGAYNQVGTTAIGYIPDAGAGLKATADAYAAKGLPGVTGTGEFGNLSVDSQGNVSYSRSDETQGYMDALQQGLFKTEGLYDDLLGRIQPGYGELSKALENVWNNAKSSRMSDLQSQLARRRVLGASFAEDLKTSTANEMDQQKAAALAEAKTEELKLTNQVIGDQTTARTNTISTALGQIQYEIGVTAGLMQNAQNAMVDLQKSTMEMYTAAAQLELAGGIAKAEISAQTGMAGLAEANASKTLAETLDAQSQIAEAQLVAGLGNTHISTFPQYSQQTVEGNAAQQQSFGSMTGSILGGLFGNEKLFA